MKGWSLQKIHYLSHYDILTAYFHLHYVDFLILYGGGVGRRSEAAGRAEGEFVQHSEQLFIQTIIKIVGLL